MTQRVLYVPLRLRLRPELLQRYIRGDRTTIIDVQLIRLPDDRTFVLAKARTDQVPANGVARSWV